MAYELYFPGTAGLKETEDTVEANQLAGIANMVNIQGRNAEFDDKTKANLNVVEFEPVDKRFQIRKILTFVETKDVDFAAMAAAGMTQLGGDGKEFNVFIGDKPKEIFVFYRMK